MEEYLNTAYSPDREYVDGVVVGRNVGERPHSKVQQNLSVSIELKYPTLFVWPEQRLRTVPDQRCRVPDLCVTVDDPGIDVFEQPPLICIEILSRKDRLSRVLAKLEEYAAMGVPHIWLLDPLAKTAKVFRNGRLDEAAELTAGPDISLPLSDVFRGL